MTNILVSGLINIETTLKVDGFPYTYAPVRYPFFGVNTTVSGVGYNITKALTILGDSVQFLSLIGDDSAGQLVRSALSTIQVDDSGVLSQLENTCQSVILYDPDGRRSINTDLKDIQEQTYPVESFEQALSKTSLAVLCNINFSRPMLAKAHQAGVPIATDVHAISDIHDAYNSDFMHYATVMFQSHEHLPDTPEAWVRQIWAQYGTPIMVIGLGGEGALLAIRKDNFIERVPAVKTRDIVSTIGAGDSLFSAFIHTYARTNDPYLAIKKAVVFASYKIGVAGAADGFLTSEELDAWMTKLQNA
ncbi:MAG: carbohydrate kinase family protein [Aggregatilineales bacterium]